MNAGVACFSAFFLGMSFGLLNSALPRAQLAAINKVKRKRKKKKILKPEESKSDAITLEVPVSTKESIEVLMDIYQDDLTITSTPKDKHLKFKVFLYPNIIESQINCSVFLSVVLPQKYPQVNPIFELVDPVGLNAITFGLMKERLLLKIEEFRSKSKLLVFETCSWVREVLIELNPTPLPSPILSNMNSRTEESLDDSANQLDNQIQEEYMNRNRRPDELIMLNSVNNIKTIAKELQDVPYKVPANIRRFDYKHYFEELEIIGKGGGGTVYKVVNKIDECLYAVKIINLKGQKESYINGIMKEVLVLSKLQHQNIVRYHNSWFEENSDEESSSSEEEIESDESSLESSESDSGWAIEFQRSRGSIDPFAWEGGVNKKKACKLYIQMEFCALNSLQESLNTRLPSPEEAWKMLKEILHGLVYIHSRKTIHRDLKPSNIFLGADGEVKLGDFGLAMISGSNKAEDFSVGTPLYWSPEHTTGVYINKSDMFSLGIIFFEMWRKFDSMMQKVEEIRNLTKRHILPLNYSAPEEVKTIILWLTEANPNDRPNAEDLLRSSYLPHQIDNATFEEVLRVAMRPNTVENAWLYQAIFKQENLPFIQFTYNSTSAINKVPLINRRKVKVDSMLNTSVNMKFREAFMNAGAVEIHPPLLYPYCKNFTIAVQDRNGTCKAVKIEAHPNVATFIEKSGITVQLPDNSIMAWAQKIAKNDFGGIVKRFSLQSTYKTAGTREHPKESKEISLDICYESALYHPHLKFCLQAEVLALSYKSIKEVFCEQKGVIELQISDSRIIDAILDYFEINPDLRVKILKVLTSMYRTKTVNIKKKLSEIGLNFSISEKLETYFKLQGKLSQIKEYLKKQPIYRDKNLQQLLNEDFVHLEQTCEVYGIKNVIFDFSVIDENLLCYSGFLCRIIYKGEVMKENKGKKETYLLAAGGCSDNLIEFFTKRKNNFIASRMSNIGVTIYQDTIISLLLQSGAYSWMRGPSVFLSSNISVNNGELDENTKKKLEIIVDLWKNNVSAIYNYNDMDKDSINELCRRYKIRFWVHLEHKNKKAPEKKFEEDPELRICLRDNAQTSKNKTTEEINRKELVDYVKEKLRNGSLRLTFLSKGHESESD